MIYAGPRRVTWCRERQAVPSSALGRTGSPHARGCTALRNSGVAGAPGARPYAVGRRTRRRGSAPPADRRGAWAAGCAR